MAHVVDTHHHGSNGPAGRGALAIVTALTVLGATAAFFLLARAPGSHLPPPRRAVAPVATWMKVACADESRPAGAALMSCPRTSTLRLGIEPSSGKGSLALALLPPDGLLMWSFPDEVGRSAKLDDANFTVVELPLDAAMAPGVYQVFALRSEAPLTRTTVRKRLDDAMEGGLASTHEDLVAARVLVTP